MEQIGTLLRETCELTIKED